MDLKQLLNDDDAVSPVIGVILMVAITVILAAVIATFVLGLGDSLSNTAPQATFSFEYDQGDDSVGGGDYSGSSNSAGDGLLTVTHDGGDQIEAGNLEISGSSQTDGPLTNAGFSASSEITAGTQVQLRVDDGDTIRVVYSAESGGSSATLARWDGPEA